MKKEMNKNEIYKKLGSFKCVENMTSSRRNEIPNQFILYFENGQMFQSYKSIIAVVFDTWKSKENPYYLGKDWDYSKTTGKYRNDFLNNTKKETLEDLKNEIAILIEGL